MADFNRSRRDRPKRNFNKPQRRKRTSDREFNGNSTPTLVICSSCNKECEIPFKPTTSKPVFCSDCFRKRGKEDSNNNHSNGNISNRDIDIINEKLNKIMQALEIE
ncbi:MAG: hypothetical protein CMH64_03895 [Nanoarchaeota archaeon]|nr:hypothetical protein [Nanoarchaeota archaeon]|tara:strand:+ start:176 stop:493 length:318 start_codon:yes stop_codon:yes gene_type:complete